MIDKNVFHAVSLSAVPKNALYAAQIVAEVRIIVYALNISGKYIPIHLSRFISEIESNISQLPSEIRGIIHAIIEGYSIALGNYLLSNGSASTEFITKYEQGIPSTPQLHMSIGSMTIINNPTIEPSNLKH